MKRCFSNIWNILILLLIGLSAPSILAQQIDIQQIQRMPNQPQPYEMRNWKQVALGYDSLVFDFNQSGQYLPLIRIIDQTVNYPSHASFGLHTVVGTPYPESAEAINILPAVISATLVGVDKSGQPGHNWVLYCEEFFNRRPEENVYLNNWVTNSGHDWWYDTMPNIFFYQLYHFYPNTGDFNWQFRMVADRWLQAVEKMGGKIAPWTRPRMNYRAWKLSTMEPLASGVKEPEAAGAIGWLLYQAYVKTGAEKYRIGAEWCLEFLSQFSTNPFYELQLPYGVYIAARMNAELGTFYNMEKLVDWCFTTQENVRQWGATLGNWGGYDCAGLIGEAKYAGYAFAMNGFEQAGALVPMVRYDDRFARAIGKWMLNLANASRLFYSKYLPDEHQDNEKWAQQYDPHSYIAYESLRQYALHTGTSPYATGDAMRGGWGQTNLALYGSSHVGILGGIVDTTNVPMILKLDALKTDYFRDDAYPTFLYFNPHDEEKQVEIDVGTTACDLYDAVSNQFLQNGASGITSFKITGNSAIVLVLTPTGGMISYDLNRMLVDDVVVDYRSANEVTNYPPRIKGLAADQAKVMINSEAVLYCTVEDRDADEINFAWRAEAGTFSGTGAPITWKAPGQAGTYPIICSVSDGKGGVDTARVAIEVIDNHPPIIQKISAQPSTVDLNGNTELICYADDPDQETLTFTWQAVEGTLQTKGNQATWTAPSIAGLYYVRCTVTDPRGGMAADSIGIVVGRLIAHLPFDGDVKDISGFKNHGEFFGVKPVPDQAANANQAYYFDGIDDMVTIPNNPILNCQEQITVCFWMNIAEFYSREAYPISHGNWENRWKLSITPEKKLRWTVKTVQGVKDLDTKNELVTERFYHIVARYTGHSLDLFLDGRLNSSVDHNGLILSTSIDLSIGRVLPNNTTYNFKGVLDDIRLYNQALDDTEIGELYQAELPVPSNPTAVKVETYHLFQNYPNPFNHQTRIRYQLPQSGRVTLCIYDVLGQKVRQLFHGEQPAGIHCCDWDGKNALGKAVASGLYFYEIQVNEYWQKRKLLFLK